MQLTPTQKRILKAVQLRADASAEEVAAQLGCRPHTVRRCVQMLLAQNILREAVYINLAPLGFTRYNLLFSRSRTSDKQKAALVRDLVADQQVIFVAEIGGDWEYEVSFAVRSSGELDDFLDRIAGRLEGGFFDKSLVIVLEKHLFGTKLLDPALQVRPLSLFCRVAPARIDAVDHKLLRVLANGGGNSQREIARAVGIPPSTMAYRLNSLKERGIIVGHYYVQNAVPYGLLRFKILIYCRGVLKKTRAALYEFARQHMNIDLLIVCAGVYDYELVVQANSYAEVIVLLEQLRMKFKNEICHLKVVSCFTVHKFSDYPLRDYEAAAPL